MVMSLKKVMNEGCLVAWDTPGTALSWLDIVVRGVHEQ